MTSICLCDLEVGVAAHFHEARLDPDVRDLLHELGLTPSSRLRLCKPGEPYIVQVRSTRIGLSRAVARSIFVIPERAASG